MMFYGCKKITSLQSGCDHSGKAFSHQKQSASSGPLLCGEKDHAGDVKPFNRKWAAGEGFPLVWVPGAGHNSNVDKPVFVNEQIERFVEELCS